MIFNKKTRNLFFLSFIFSSLMISSCVDDPCFTYYQVEYPFEIGSVSDSISIGDTVFFDIAIATSHKNIMGGSNIVLPLELIYHNLNIVRIENDSIDILSSDATPACSSFDYYCKKGALDESYHNYFYPLVYESQNDSLLGSYKFVAKESGTYVFFLYDYAFELYRSDPLGEQNISISDVECLEYYWHGLFLNQNVDNNYYILDEHKARFDTVYFLYYDRNDPNYDRSNYHNPNNKNYVNDMKQNLRFGTYSFVVK